MILLDPRSTSAAQPPLAVDREVVYCAPRIDGDVRLADGEVAAFEAPILRPIDLVQTHGIEITLANLEQMAAAYNPSVEAAALNFDHAWGGPAHGFARRLWLVGETLWARFEQLSGDAVAAIRSGQWPRRSAELTTRHAATGGWYFTGLALLGNASPAVWGLGPAQLLSRPVLRVPLEGETTMTTDTEPAAAAAEQLELAAEDEAPETPIPEEPPAAAAAAPDEAAGDAASEAPELAAEETETETEAEAEPEAVAALSARVAELELRARRAEARNDVRSFLDTLDARLTPALRRVAEPLLLELEVAHAGARVALAQGDEPVALAAALRRLLSALPKFQPLDAGELAASDAAETIPDSRTDEVQELHRKHGLTRERVAELQTKYGFKVH